MYLYHKLFSDTKFGRVDDQSKLICQIQCDIPELSISSFSIKNPDIDIYFTTTPDSGQLITLDSIIANFGTDTTIEDVMDTYNQRKADGYTFYNNFRARLYLKYDAQEITISEATECENHLRNISDSLNSGNWLTAQVELPLRALLGIFTQELKDEIQAGIDAYVAGNY